MKLLTEQQHVARLLCEVARSTPMPTLATDPITLVRSPIEWGYLGDNDKITVPNRDAANELIRQGMIEVHKPEVVAAAVIPVPKRRESSELQRRLLRIYCK